MKYKPISDGDVYMMAFATMQEIANDQTVSPEAALDMISGVCRATRKLLELFADESEQEKNKEATT